MNYTDIVDTALAYTDREDSETTDKVDRFLLVVESLLNRKLKLSVMSKRTVTETVTDQEFYSLPPDFAGMRDIEVRDSITAVERDTFKYVSPETFNSIRDYSCDKVYTIIANQIQIIPEPEGRILEVVYYKKLAPLTPSNLNNDITLQAPDLYIFGLCSEINYYIKDKVAAEAWRDRLNAAIEEVNLDDEKNRWSGPVLQTRIEV